MAMSVQQAINHARTSWLLNATVVDPRWPLRQLHGLYDLLIQNRDELISTLASDLHESSIAIERDFSSLVDDLSAYISYVSNSSPNHRGHPRHHARFGTPEIELQPNGVVLILSTAKNPFQHTLAAFTAAVAARNSVVLAAYELHHFFSILQREVPKHLDSFALSIIPVTKLESLAEKVDHVVTIGVAPPGSFPSLKSSKVTQVPVDSGHRFAVIPEEGIDFENIVDQIASLSKSYGFPSHGCSAIFVHETHFSRLSSALVDRCGTSTKLHVPSSGHLQKCDRLTPELCAADLSKLLADERHDNLELMLQAAQSEELLMLVQMTSFEQMMIALDRLDKIEVVTLVSTATTPENLKHYFKKWTKAPILSVGDIRSEIPAVFDPAAILTDGLPLATFPITLFSNPRLCLSQPRKPKKSSVEAIRKAYEHMIPKLKPEHPGGRIDFFVQVQYVLGAVGISLGLVTITGLWYGGKALSRRYW